jgi:hypothetical protein
MSAAAIASVPLASCSTLAKLGLRGWEGNNLGTASGQFSIGNTGTLGLGKRGLFDGFDDKWRLSSTFSNVKCCKNVTPVTLQAAVVFNSVAIPIHLFRQQ